MDKIKIPWALELNFKDKPGTGRHQERKQLARH
jgi:hypothetical protein